MYKHFFGLQSDPFGTSPDPRFLFMMPHTREALACLEYGISARKGFTVLTGEVGTGKTTLLRQALSSFDAQKISAAFVFNSSLDILDLLEFILTDFGVPATSRTKSSMLLQLNQWLIESFRAGRTCVVVIDEAQTLSWELLEEIRLLTNLEVSSEKLLQIVLSGQPELEAKLRNPSVRQLRQRVALWCRTQPLTKAQTHAYVAERLRIAGASAPIFSSDALDLIHHFAQGIPRIINLLCENALVLAYVEQTRTIQHSIIQAVADDFMLEAHPFLTSAPAVAAASSSIQDAHQSNPDNPLPLREDA